MFGGELPVVVERFADVNPAEHKDVRQRRLAPVHQTRALNCKWDLNARPNIQHPSTLAHP